MHRIDLLIYYITAYIERYIVSCDKILEEKIYTYIYKSLTCQTQVKLIEYEIIQDYISAMKESVYFLKIFIKLYILESINGICIIRL